MHTPLLTAVVPGAIPGAGTLLFKNAGWLRQMSGGLKSRTGGRAAHSSGQFSNTLHSVTAAFFVVNEAAPGQNRLREPFSIVRKAKSRASGLQNRVTQCEPGVHVHFSIGYERASALAWFGIKTSPGQHRGMRPFLVCSSTVERRAHNPQDAGANPAGPTIQLSLVAQSKEHPPLKRRVGGANPPKAANSMPM